MGREIFGGFGYVSKKIMSDPDISPTAKALYALLSTFADEHEECFPSKETICKRMNLENKTVTRRLRELEDHGIIMIEREWSGNLLGRNRYRLNHNAGQQKADDSDMELFGSSKNEPIGPDTPLFGSSKPDMELFGSSTETPPNNTNNQTLPFSEQYQELNSTSPDGQFFDQVCKVMNAGRKRAKCKGGGLKRSAAEYMLAEVMRKHSNDEVLCAARELSAAGDKKKLDWFGLRDYLETRQKGD